MAHSERKAFMKTKKTKEEKTCLDVLNLKEWDAVQLIRERGLVSHTIKRDREDFPRKDNCYISSRINLKVRRGKVISAQIW